MKSKKNVGYIRCTCPQMFFFSLKVSVKREKKVFVVCDEAPHFLRGPIGFSLFSLYVNPAQCLQPIYLACPHVTYVKFMWASDPRFLLLVSTPPTPQTKFYRRHLWIKALSWVLISKVGLLNFKYIHAKALW